MNNEDESNNRDGIGNGLGHSVNSPSARQINRKR